MPHPPRTHPVVIAATIALLSACLLGLGVYLAASGAFPMPGPWVMYMALFSAVTTVVSGLGRLWRLPSGDRLHYLLRGGATPAMAYWASPRCGRYQVVAGLLLAVASAFAAIVFSPSSHAVSVVFALYLASEFHHLYRGWRYDAALRVVRHGEH